MTRPSFQRCVLWLLPLLLLRAFVPAGFMVSAAASGLQLTLCPAQVSLPAAPAMQTDAHAGHHVEHGGGIDEHAGHDMDHGGSVDQHAGHHGSKHFESPCPFGMAAVAIATTVPVATGAFVAVTDETFVAPDSPAASAGPLRADRIRGPPFFS